MCTTAARSPFVFPPIPNQSKYLAIVRSSFRHRKSSQEQPELQRYSAPFSVFQTYFDGKRYGIINQKKKSRPTKTTRDPIDLILQPYPLVRGKNTHSSEIGKSVYTWHVHGVYDVSELHD